MREISSNKKLVAEFFVLQLVVGRWQLAGGSWQVVCGPTSGGCEKGWHYVSPPAGSGGENVTEQQEQQEYSQHSVY